MILSTGVRDVDIGRVRIIMISNIYKLLRVWLQQRVFMSVKQDMIV